jgi:hypothetical protein
LQLNSAHRPTVGNLWAKRLSEGSYGLVQCRTLHLSSNNGCKWLTSDEEMDVFVRGTGIEMGGLWTDGIQTQLRLTLKQGKSGAAVPSNMWAGGSWGLGKRGAGRLAASSCLRAHRMLKSSQRHKGKAKGRHPGFCLLLPKEDKKHQV